jgi:hypothetical protein
MMPLMLLLVFPALAEEWCATDEELKTILGYTGVKKGMFEG